MAGRKKRYSRRKVVSAIETCFTRLDDTNPKLRLRATVSLGNIGAAYPKHVWTIEPLLVHLDDPVLQKPLVISLGKICRANPGLINENITTTLLPLLKDRQLGAQAGEAVGYVAGRNRKALSALLEFMGKTDVSWTLSNAITALAVAGEEDFRSARIAFPELMRRIGASTENVLEPGHSHPWIHLSLSAEKALVRLGTRHPAIILGCLGDRFNKLDEDLKYPAMRILAKVLAQHSRFAEDYVKVLASGFSQNTPGSRKGVSAFCLQILASARPELVRPYFQKIHQMGAVGKRCLWEIAARDPKTVLAFMVEYDYPSTIHFYSTFRFAKARPGRYLRFCLDHPEWLERKAFLLALTRIQKISEELRPRFKAPLGRFARKMNFDPDLLAVGALRFPELARSFFPVLKDYFQQSSESVKRYSKRNTMFWLLRSLRDDSQPEPEIYSLILIDPHCLDRAARFTLRTGGFEHPVAKKELKRMLESFTLDPEDFAHHPPAAGEVIRKAKQKTLDGKAVSEEMLSGLEQISRNHPELVSHYVDLVLSDRRKIPVHSLKYTLLTLGNLASLRKDRSEDILSLVIPTLDHSSYTAFNAARKALKTMLLAQPELIPEVEEHLASLENETILRRGTKILRTVERRLGLPVTGTAKPTHCN